MRIHSNPGQKMIRPVSSKAPSRPANTDDALFTMLDPVGQWEQGECKETLQVRWHREKMPLAVALESAPAGSRWNDAELRKLLSTALKQWELAGEGAIQFRTVQGKQADILIQWTDAPVEGREYEVGHTDRKVQNRIIMQSTITLLLEPAIDQRLSAERRKNRMYSTLLHELGHALGMEHTESERDVMHHRGWRNTQLSNNDVYQLKTLYSRNMGFRG